MKRILTLPCVFILTIILMGCENNHFPIGNSENSPIEDMPLETTETTYYETSINILTDSEIHIIYQRAVEVFSWFALTTPHDWMDYIVDDETGFTFVRVDYESINTLADLQAYPYGIFTPEVVNQMFSMHPPYVFREFDGVLYMLAGGRGGNMTRGHEVREIIRESNERIIYRIIVEVMYWHEDISEWEVIDYKVYDFVLVLIDGQWLFSNFSLVR